MQNESPILHEFDILGSGIDALPIENRALEHVAELGLGTQKRGSHEIHHTPVQHDKVLNPRIKFKKKMEKDGVGES